ncbi:DNA topoisomerase [Butyrivibrio sp. YAB3001]|uniref:DNA topoisomerase n=1 Tax=Butyrivibrio sp. YAB3001 TaxID=1520812 RepID=UPI0008F65311|nr:DNA topoisomerase [Butyrivibrio sp. YAB3001]SFC35288.1 DNA topoisomerase-3 [Butyrivibrio sp. YAB3001]
MANKSVYIAEKPSVAQAFAAALKINFSRRDGYLESDEAIVTWCVGHLVTMSYPEVYDEKYKRWALDTLPFIPTDFKYEVIGNVSKQFRIVKELLNRADVETIYICTDSGREGEYIYRLVDMQAGVTGKVRKRVWIDSQTEEEILRGIREAKDDSEYDNLGAAAFLRAKEDYLMGINFSRALTLKYAYSIKNYLNIEKCVISVGRVMTCVLGIVVDREREIREFVKTPFYRVIGGVDINGKKCDAEWRVTPDSYFDNSPELYSEKGFKTEESAKKLIASLVGMNGAEFKEDSDGKEVALQTPIDVSVEKCEKKKEVKNAPLLYNLAELQNDCSRFFKINPDETLAVAQELYEKKLTTYPRTDARVLSSAIAKVIDKNISGLTSYETCSIFAKSILQHEAHKGIEKSRYVNDKAITDHYAIIPTGQGLSALSTLSPTSAKVYEIIVRRFLAIFYPPATYQKVALEVSAENIANPGKREHFFANFKILTAKGYLHVMDYSFFKNKKRNEDDGENTQAQDNEEQTVTDEELFEYLQKLKKKDLLKLSEFCIKEGETSPPKRYNSGTIILTMENAGQFIEDEELRAQIKGSGIGTSATRAGILTKLVNIKYLNLNKKTQIITPTQMGEMVYETVACSMKPMLNPALTASWEKGLTGVAEGNISEEEYMSKLDDFVSKRTNLVKNNDYRNLLMSRFAYVSSNYKEDATKKSTKTRTKSKKKDEQEKG